MFSRERRAMAGPPILTVAAILWIAVVSPCHAQRPASKRVGDDTLPLVSSFRPSPPAIASQHPLAAVIEYARQEQKYLRRTVNDFTCRLVKRERIGGFLQDYHYIELEVREGFADGGRIAQPLSIYLRFLGPKMIAGRKIVFVEGQNEGKILVRNGGRHFDYVIASIDPDGDNAREESLVPITQIGFTRLLARMIEVLERHQIADPTGENTEVVRIAGAKINERPCTLIRVTHPRQTDGLEFHVANVFVDDQLHVPVRVDYSDWPKYPNGPVPLIAEYTYTELQLNVNLPDAAFNRSRLRSPRD